MSDKGKISDGYHTFDELYEHRIVLWKALCRAMQGQGNRNSSRLVWRTRLHSDGSSFPGWFVLGMGYNAGEQITYHLPDKEWASCDFALELPQAPEFDNHSPSDVLKRIEAL